MPKIFKDNKLVLFLSNVLAISVWLLITTFLKDLILTDNLPFYIYKIADLIKFIPPAWLTYYLWVARKS